MHTINRSTVSIRALGAFYVYKTSIWYENIVIDMWSQYMGPLRHLRPASTRLPVGALLSTATFCPHCDWLGVDHCDEALLSPLYRKYSPYTKIRWFLGTVIWAFSRYRYSRHRCHHPLDLFKGLFWIPRMFLVVGISVFCLFLSSRWSCSDFKVT